MGRINDYILKNIKNYINLTLGELIDLDVWEDFSNFPYYLKNNYEYLYSEIFGIKIILVVMTENSVKELNNLKKQLNTIYNNIDEEFEIVCLFDELSDHYRKKLIDLKLPFIIPGKQLYLPFIGTMYRDTGGNYKIKLGYNSELISQDKMFSLPAERIFLGFLTNEIYSSKVKELSKVTGISTSSVSRALMELVGKEILEKENDGRRNLYRLKDSRLELWKTFKDQLISPVKKTIYIKKDEFVKLENKSLKRTGETLLSDISSIIKPRIPQYSIHEKKWENIKNNIIYEEDPSNIFNSKIQLDIWGINLFQNKKIYQYFEIYILLNSVADPRIEKEVSKINDEIIKYLDVDSNREWL